MAQENALTKRSASERKFIDIRAQVQPPAVEAKSVKTTQLGADAILTKIVHPNGRHFNIMHTQTHIHAHIQVHLCACGFTSHPAQQN